MSRLFYAHGKCCASHPWEVMVAFLSLSICMFSMGPNVLLQSSNNSSAQNCVNHESHSQQTHDCIEKSQLESTEIVILTISRCMALLYVYHQFRTLYKLGSKYLVGIASLFTVFSIFIFCNSVFNFLNGNLAELNKALPFFLLLSDLSKASLLAQFALTSFTREEVRENIARGMAILGPSLTLDTLVETLAIGVGTLSGVSRIEEISCFACLSVLVNYIVFMTFFPACLSLALELSHNCEEGAIPVWQLSSLAKVLKLESEQTPNPVIQRVKLIMSAGLMLVHTLSRWPTISDTDSNLFDNKLVDSSQHILISRREPNVIELFFIKILAVGSEQIVMIGLVCALAIKYIFFENKDNYSEHIITVAQQQQQPNQPNQLNQYQSKSHQLQEQKQIEDEKQDDIFIAQNTQESQNEDINKSRNVETPSILITCQDSDTESMIIERSKCNNEATSSSRSSSIKGDTTDTRSKSPSFFIGDDYSSDFSETEFIDREVQTDETRIPYDCAILCNEVKTIRDITTLKQLLESEDGANQLNDLEVKHLVEKKIIPAYKLESILGNAERGVSIRRKLIASAVDNDNVLDEIPFTKFDYSLVLGACCENVIGYLPVPLGIAGPLLLNDKKYYVPMATTEGCLVASTNRGCRALSFAGGVKSSVVYDGMTRGPVIHFPSAIRASEAMRWLQVDTNFELLKVAFDSTSRFARLQSVHSRVAGRYLYLRFVAFTGDAMGMNMLSKGTEIALQIFQKYFPDVEMTCLSGNFCTDKKPSAVNWIEGRGKSVVCEANIPEKVVKDVLKTSVEALVELNISKNLIGSAMAGSIGGFNAQAANIVAAIYIATGQDPAQTVGSSNCITIMEPNGTNNKDLYISCTMPSIEIGTIGGGTVLHAQGACLELLGVRGCSIETPGSKSSELANIICGTVLAAELSLLSALAAGHLVRSHMKHNRSNININQQSLEENATESKP